MSDKTVGIFVAASLPGTVGIGEVDAYAKEFFELFEASEFFSVVESEGADELRGDTSEGVLDGLVDSASFEVRDGSCHQDACLAFDEGDDVSFVVRAVNGVAFPRFRTEPCIDRGRLLSDTHTPRNEPSFLMRVPAVLTFSMALSEFFIEIAIRPFVRVNRGVNAFIRNAHRPVAWERSAQSMGDLFGRPFRAQFGGDVCAKRCAC